MLEIPHRTEQFTGGCLIACSQMALAFFGISVSQEELAQLLDHVPGVGTPARKILRLSRYGVSVLYQQNGTLKDIEQEIRRNSVVIAFVRTGNLPYWEEDVPHAVIVAGIEAGVLYLNDPSFREAPVPVPEDDFILAWDEFGCQWAAVTRLQRESP